MIVNAYEFLSTSFPNLMPKLDSNLSVSGALQAIFTYVAHLSAEERINVTGLRASLSIVEDKKREDDCFQAKLRLDFLVDATAAPVVKVDKKILWQRNLVIVQVLLVNRSIQDIAKNLVEILEQVGAKYEVPWEDIRCGSKKVLIRRGGRRLEMDVGQKEWLPDEEIDQVQVG